MAEWRFGRGWTRAGLRDRLAEYSRLEPNFATLPARMTEENGWRVDGLDEAVGRGPPGPPRADRLFARARRALIAYEFSDPRIVDGHFEPHHAMVGRTILLELKVLGIRYLVGVRIGAAIDETHVDRTEFGIRYDTLEGHIERGSEWVLLSKDHETGLVRFRIEARWKYGEFPNCWTAIGFRLLAPYYREQWRRHAHERLRALAERTVRPTPPRRPPRGPVGPPPVAAPPEPDDHHREDDR